MPLVFNYFVYLFFFAQPSTKQLMQKHNANNTESIFFVPSQ